MQKRYDLCFVTALVLLTLASVSDVLANGAYPDPLGGSGGSPYEDKCKPGDYLVGFAVAYPVVSAYKSITGVGQGAASASSAASIAPIKRYSQQSGTTNCNPIGRPSAA